MIKVRNLTRKSKISQGEAKQLVDSSEHCNSMRYVVIRVMRMNERGVPLGNRSVDERERKAKPTTRNMELCKDDRRQHTQAMKGK